MDRIVKLFAAFTRVVGIWFARVAPDHPRSPQPLAHPWLTTTALLAVNVALAVIVTRSTAGVEAQVGPHIAACNPCYEGYVDGRFWHAADQFRGLGMRDPGTNIQHGPQSGICHGHGHNICCTPD